MNCHLAEQLIQRSLDAPLTPLERSRMDDHLDHCSSCRRAWNEYRQLSQTVSDWVVSPDPTEMPAALFTAQTLSRVAQRPHPVRLTWAVAVSIVMIALLSPLASPWLPALPHWSWPEVTTTDLPTGDFWAAALGTASARWAELVLLPALVVNILLLHRARRTA